MTRKVIYHRHSPSLLQKSLDFIVSGVGCLLGGMVLVYAFVMLSPTQFLQEVGELRRQEVKESLSIELRGISGIDTLIPKSKSALETESHIGTSIPSHEIG